MNIRETHQRQMKKFQHLQKCLPDLQDQLENQRLILRECQNNILEQRKAAAIFLLLDKKKKKTEEEQKRYEEVKKIKLEKSVAYDEVGKIEDHIRQLEKRIKFISSKQAEIDYIEKTAFILHEYDQIENAQRSGMPQNSISFPQHLQHSYTNRIINPIKVLFVTKEHRSIFNKVHSLEPHFTAKNVKALYCLFLKNFSRTSYDTSIDEVLDKKGKVYLTSHMLIFPEENNKTLDHVIRYYKIPIKEEIEIYVEYPDENVMISSTNVPTTSQKKVSRKGLFNEYKEIVGLACKPVELINKLTEVCENCNKQNNIIEDTHRGELICGNCGLIVTSQMTAKGYNGIPYKEDRQACIRKSDYKPIMHLKDIIKQRQAIESFIVPDEVIKLIDSEREKHRIAPENMRKDICREWLQKLSKKDIEKKYNFPKYYKHINQIMLKLGGPPPIRYTYEDEKAIEYWFQRIEKVFKIFIPLYGFNERSNLFSYNYLMRRICILIAYYQHNGEEQDWWLEHAKTWPLLKDDQKLFTYEATMRKMCETMNEPFFPLVD